MTTDLPFAELRQRSLGVLARAERPTLEQHLADLEPLASFTVLRGPECGLAMVRGRVGSDGEAFNFIEATLSRASILDADGKTGHGYVLGRDLDHALMVARIDAALQSEARVSALTAQLIDPLAELEDQRRRVVEAKAAGTEVHFFTMATGRP